uniref:Uncharacterized protein n=1 Tax=viral metagenome TaxID=1070528 RepID=A0A6H1Z871_9ZZZZ
MKAEECPRLDKCLSVKSLFSRDWESDAELAAAIRELSETCPGPPDEDWSPQNRDILTAEDIPRRRAKKETPPR